MGYDIEKEKREAIEAGQRALSSLRTAKENLNSAKKLANKKISHYNLHSQYVERRGISK